MTRIAIYTRVSTDAQAEEHRTSLDEQLAACSDYAKAKDWQIVDRFSDVATGTSRADKRPGLKALFDAAARSEFDGVLSWKGDRLARGSGIAGDIEEALRPLNVFVEAVTEPLDLDLLGLWDGSAAGNGRISWSERASVGSARRRPDGPRPADCRSDTVEDLMASPSFTRTKPRLSGGSSPRVSPVGATSRSPTGSTSTASLLRTGMADGRKDT